MTTLDKLIGGASALFLAFYAGALVQAMKDAKEKDKRPMTIVYHEVQIKDDSPLKDLSR